MKILKSYFANSDVTRAFFCFIIFLTAFFTRIYYIEQKSGFHADEIMTVMLSNYSSIWEHEDYFNKKTLKGKEVKNLVLSGSNSVKDALYDVNRLYINNRDRPHTNLYYSCFRLWFAGISTTDKNEIIKLGCYLNLFFFIFSFLFFYKIALIFFKKDYLIYLSLIVAFFNTGTISSTLFLRPYELQQSILIIFTYIFIKYFNGKKHPIQLIISSAFAFLSGYYASIYVLMAFLILGIKYKDDQKALVVYFLCGIALGGLLYHKFFVGFTCGRAGECLRKLNPKLFFANLIISMQSFLEIMKNFIFYPEICTLIVISTITCIKKLQKLELPAIIFLMCVLWSAGNIFLAPFKCLRYISASFPFMSLIIPYIVAKNKNIFQYLFCLMFSVMFIISAFNKPVANIYLEQKKVSEIMKSELPAILCFNNKHCGFFQINLLLPCLDDQKFYSFTTSHEDVEKFLKQHKKILLIYDREVFRPSSNYKIKTLWNNGAIYITECYEIF